MLQFCRKRLSAHGEKDDAGFARPEVQKCIEDVAVLMADSRLSWGLEKSTSEDHTASNLFETYQEISRLHDIDWRHRLLCELTTQSEHLLRQSELNLFHTWTKSL